MSTHSAAASSDVGRSFCGATENNHKFVISDSKYILYIYARAGGRRRRWVACTHPLATSPAWKMVLRPEGPSHSLYNRREMQNLSIRRGSSSWRTERMYVFRVGTHGRCVPLFSVEAYLRHLFAENILLSSALKRARKIYIFSFHSPETRIILFNFAKTVWRCRSVAIEIEN